MEHSARFCIQSRYTSVEEERNQKLPKSREETHVNLKDYEFNSTSGKRMMHVNLNDPETGIIMFTTEGNHVGITFT
jgi:hypothetical protein